MKQGILRAFAALLLMLFSGALALAQTAAYTMHTIAAGETLSALAKDYHTTVGDIMRLNAMSADSKLAIGEKIKIPATSQPVKREATATPAKETAPAATGKATLTHTVQKGESLYRIGKQYNMPVEKLVALNHINSTGEIKPGQVLLVSDGTKPPAPAKAKTETVVSPPVTQPEPATQQPVKEVAEPPVQPEQAPVTNTITDSNTAALPAPAPVQKQNNIPATTSGKIAASQPATTSFTSNVAAPKEGFFTAQFRQNVEGRNEQTKMGAAMTFKSASGWADKKFYVLMNDAPPGSIVKVASGNNAVYAKVLWSLGAQKENDGLDFRISTAAAASLNITDEKFDVTVTYFQ